MEIIIEGGFYLAPKDPDAVCIYFVREDSPYRRPAALTIVGGHTDPYCTVTRAQLWTRPPWYKVRRWFKLYRAFLNARPVVVSVTADE